MRQGLVRLTLLVLVLLLIFGVYRLLTIEPIDAGTFFDAAGAPLVLLDPGMFGENGQETLAALRRFYPERRLLAAFEPRTNSSRRAVFQEAYAASFDAADLVCIKQPPGLEAIPASERLDAERLVTDLKKQGKAAHFFETTEELVGFLDRHCRAGDLVVCMSNGSFDELPHRLLQTLGVRS